MLWIWYVPRKAWVAIGVSLALAAVAAAGLAGARHLQGSPKDTYAMPAQAAGDPAVVEAAARLRECGDVDPGSGKDVACLGEQLASAAAVSPLVAQQAYDAARRDTPWMLSACSVTLSQAGVSYSRQGLDEVLGNAYPACRHAFLAGALEEMAALGAVDRPALSSVLEWCAGQPNSTARRWCGAAAGRALLFAEQRDLLGERTADGILRDPGLVDASSLPAVPVPASTGGPGTPCWAGYGAFGDGLGQCSGHDPAKTLALCAASGLDDVREGCVMGFLTSAWAVKREVTPWTHLDCQGSAVLACAPAPDLVASCASLPDWDLGTTEPSRPVEGQDLSLAGACRRSVSTALAARAFAASLSDGVTTADSSRRLSVSLARDCSALVVEEVPLSRADEAACLSLVGEVLLRKAAGDLSVASTMCAAVTMLARSGCLRAAVLLSVLESSGTSEASLSAQSGPAGQGPSDAPTDPQRSPEPAA